MEPERILVEFSEGIATYSATIFLVVILQYLREKEKIIQLMVIKNVNFSLKSKIHKSALVSADNCVMSSSVACQVAHKAIDIKVCDRKPFY